MIVKWALSLQSRETTLSKRVRQAMSREFDLVISHVLSAKTAFLVPVVPFTFFLSPLVPPVCSSYTLYRRFRQITHSQNNGLSQLYLNI
jgi:hypothetical protein